MTTHLATGPAARPPRPARLFVAWLAAAFLVLAGCFGVWFLLAAPRSGGALRVEIRSDVDTVVRVCFDTGQGFSEDDALVQTFGKTDRFHALYFPLPAAPVRGVQIEPLDVPGTAALGSVSLGRGDGHSPVRTFPLAGARVVDDGLVLRPAADGLLVVRGPTTPGSALRLVVGGPPVQAVPRVWAAAAPWVVLGSMAWVLAAAVAAAGCFGWPGRGLAARWFPDPWAGGLFMAVLAGAALWTAAAQRETYYLDATVSADREVIMQLYFDGGDGFLEEDSTRARVSAGPVPHVLRFPITVNRIAGLRLDPSEEPASVRIVSLVVRSQAERSPRHPPVYEFDLRDLVPFQQIDETRHEPDGSVVLTMGPRAADPEATFDLAAPVPLGVNGPYVAGRTLVAGLVWLALWVAVVEAARRLPPDTRARFVGRLRARGRRLSPAQAIWLVAAGAATLGCYPVVFCGKSFDSPNFADGTFQLYEAVPTLPGTRALPLENGRGADLGSMAWAHGPYSVVESRALFQDGELPLWNRYNYAGVALLGQGQSMFGDPLHFLVLAAGGRAWAWDAKFVLARGFFAAGVGLLVLAATECLPAALLLCFSSAFLGFFSYRLNHPAYFSFCYAPWILYAWLRVVRAADWRGAMRWAGALLLANWVEMNSGTAKEAYMLLLCLNGCGATILALVPLPDGARARRFLGLVAAGGIFCLLAAPVLLAFVDTLRQSVSNYDDRHAWQLQPGMFIGLFDDIFYRQFNFGETHFDPSGNFLLLLGCLFALAASRTLGRDRVFLAVALNVLLPLSLAFGVVPPSFIREVPLLGNVAHVDNTFSCVALIELFVVAGFGLRRCLARTDPRAWRRDALTAGGIGAALLALYFGFAQAAQHASHPFLRLNQEIPRSAFFYEDVSTLVLAAAVLAVILRRLAVRGASPAVAGLLVCCLAAIHWRLGVGLHTAFWRFTPVLPDRVDLLAPSPAIGFLRGEQRAEPFRAAGLGKNLMLGYGGMVGVETISGPDALVNRFFHEFEAAGMHFINGASAQTATRRDLADIKPFYDLLNVRYYLALPGQTLPGLPGLVPARALDLDVYRNDHAWPRAFFVDRLGEYRAPEQFAAHVRAGDGRPFAEVDEPQLRAHPGLRARLSPDPAARTVRPAANYRLTANTTAFDVDAPAPGVAVLTEAYLDGDLLATLDGRPVPVFRVNTAFRGVAVDQPGRHRLAFTYRPRGFALALGACGLGLGLLAAAGWACRARGIDPAGRLP